ncbi:LmbU family transcriptional regulator [Actinomadura geliboluensis]|uniref:LmbU family transcriptional regulator n=1 Tax=Actinomadura geliboluensis TaxID=882440 RepID=UPI0037107CC8
MSTTNGYKAAPAAIGGEAAQRDVVLPFVGKQATARKSGMVFAQNLPERSWEQIGTNLRELANSSAWWLADWLIFGESAYGWRRYREAIDRTGLDYQTLRNYAWVARRFEHHRRRDGLSFAHHAEVTRLSPPEQDYWLRKAEEQKWSRNELRRAVRESLAEQSPGLPGDGEERGGRRKELPADGGDERRKAEVRLAEKQKVTLTIELSDHQLDCYSKVAAAHGLSVDQWATRVLDAADRRTA